MKYLKQFRKEKNGLFIVYDCYTFDNFFRLLLKNGLEYEDALNYVFANCSLSALVWQERIHNKAYLLLSGKNAKDPKDAACKSILINNFLEIASKAKRQYGNR